MLISLWKKTILGSISTCIRLIFGVVTTFLRGKGDSLGIIGTVQKAIKRIMRKEFLEV